MRILKVEKKVKSVIGVNVQVPVSPEAVGPVTLSLTLSSKNSGLMKSSRNMVSGAFSQSAIDLEESRETGVKDELKEDSFNLPLLSRTEEDVCIFYTETKHYIVHLIKGKVCDFCNTCCPNAIAKIL